MSKIPVPLPPSVQAKAESILRKRGVEWRHMCGIYTRNARLERELGVCVEINEGRYWAFTFLGAELLGVSDEQARSLPEG